MNVGCHGKRQYQVASCEPYIFNILNCFLCKLQLVSLRLLQKMSFSDVPLGPPDPMFELKQASDGDTSSTKIDVGIGVYRGTKPGYHEFQAIANAKRVLEQQRLGHEYLPTTGIQSFVNRATSLLFGTGNPIIKSQRIASVQTVGGTGAVRLGAAFLNRNIPTHSSTSRLPNSTEVYVGTPAWPNYVPLFAHAGFNVKGFNHLDRARGCADLQAALEAVSSAPSRSIFILQVCCHNPTGQDYDRNQWIQLADEIHSRNHFVFFDIAYQGLASSMEEDAWPVCYFAERGIDLIVCQSFSKHMGLYSERVGVLHVLCKSSDIATNVKDQLRSLIRWEVSSTPAYGGRLADIVMSSESLTQEWLGEVQAACDRMIKVRQDLHHLLVDELRTPGNWGHVLRERGLFSFTALSKAQVTQLRQYHVYLAASGRVNVAGLNESNVRRFAEAVDAVVRSTSVDQASSFGGRQARL